MSENTGWSMADSQASRVLTARRRASKDVLAAQSFLRRHITSWSKGRRKVSDSPRIRLNSLKMGASCHDHYRILRKALLPATLSQLYWPASRYPRQPDKLACIHTLIQPSRRPSARISLLDGRSRSAFCSETSSGGGIRRRATHLA